MLASASPLSKRLTESLFLTTIVSPSALCFYLFVTLTLIVKKICEIFKKNSRKFRIEEKLLSYLSSSFTTS